MSFSTNILLFLVVEHTVKTWITLYIPLNIFKQFEVWNKYSFTYLRGKVAVQNSKVRAFIKICLFKGGYTYRNQILAIHGKSLLIRFKVEKAIVQNISGEKWAIQFRIIWRLLYISITQLLFVLQIDRQIYICDYLIINRHKSVS